MAERARIPRALEDTSWGASEEVCPWCGQLQHLGLFEVWDSRDFMLEACCEVAHELALDEMQEGPAEGAALLRRLQVEELVGAGRLRRVLDCGAGSLALDWNPREVAVSQAAARAFVGRHHAHCGPPAGWKFGAGMVNGGDLIGVVMVGRPVARMLDDGSRLEVNRLVVRRDLGQGLTWDACSMLYAIAAREARKRGYRELITYTLASESALSLKAAGWAEYGVSPGGSWSRASRCRTDKASTSPKRRWEKLLR